MFDGRIPEWLILAACAALIFDLTLLGQLVEQLWAAVWMSAAAVVGFVASILLPGRRNRRGAARRSNG